MLTLQEPWTDGKEEPVGRMKGKCEVKSVFELPVKLEQAASLFFKFSTTPKDISFGVKFMSTSDEGEENFLRCLERIPSHLGAYCDTVNIPSGGTVTFIWVSFFTTVLVKYTMFCKIHSL